MLEQKISELTAAVVALTAVMQQQATAPASAQQAAVVAPPAPPVAPPAATLPNGMPGGPFGTPAAAPVAAPAGAPFSDLNGATKYAMSVYEVLAPKGQGEVITQLIQHLCGSSSLNDLPPTSYPAFYTELEKIKAA